MIEHLGLVFLGFAAGVLGSMLGLGGGLIIVPVLTFLGFPPTTAVSSSLFATLSNAAASTALYSRQKRIDYSLGIKIGLLCIPGTFVGAYLSTVVSPDLFKILFSILLVSTVYVFLRKRDGLGKKSISKYMVLFTVACSFFAGMISSFFGIGGGLVYVPMMVVVMGLTMKRAAPTSQFVLLFAATSGAAIHVLLGHSDFLQAGLLSAGAFFGGLTGARLSVNVKEVYLRVLISALFLVAALKLSFDSVTGNSLFTF